MVGTRAPTAAPAGTVTAIVRPPSLMTPVAAGVAKPKAVMALAELGVTMVNSAALLQRPVPPLPLARTFHVRATPVGSGVVLCQVVVRTPVCFTSGVLPP
jgi:hypothetical protein